MNSENHLHRQWRSILAAGVLLLLLSTVFLVACGGGGSSTGGGGSSSSSPTHLITDSTLSTLQIEADIPPMQVGHQVILAVSIYPTGGHIPVSDVQVVKNATAIVTNATPVGTPGSTLVDAFGPNHSVIATATLETSTAIFSVVPTGPQPKPLDLEKVEWDWFVTPLADKDQSFGVDIEVRWTSTINGQQSPQYTLGHPNFSVYVEPLSVAPTPTPTPQPIISVTPVKIDIGAILSSLLPYLLGTGGLVALIYLQVRKRLAKRKTRTPQPRKRRK